MRKLLSLIKACMTSGMSLFKIKSKSDKKSSKIMLPIVLFFICSFSVWSYANMLLEPLSKVNLEYIVLTIFVFVSFLLTLIEGVYKSSSLIFNTKDDNLLLSLPIKKSTILFVRIFKFYLFEVIYNALFLLPCMVAYIRYVKVDFTYYIVSFLMLLLLPIIPIIISCVIGFFSASSSTKFKYKNIVQIVITFVIVLLLLYFSFNLENILKDLILNANNVNGFITKLYYPAYLYVKLVSDFNLLELLLFILGNIVLLMVSIYILSKFYFKINSKLKVSKTNHSNGKYVIKSRGVIKAIINKELNRFINTPVLVVNAAFGLILFVIASIMLSIKFDGAVSEIMKMDESITIDAIKLYIPLIILLLISVGSYMSSITSSMISLEGGSLNILKSIPVKPIKILIAKVLCAVLIMMPFILLGDIIMFIKFKLSFIEIVLLLMISISLPLIAELVGIICNLKYPKMDAENDTEVVKQSMSSFVAVMFGFILMGITNGLSFGLAKLVSVRLSLFICLIVSVMVCALLMLYLNNKGTKLFNNIQA